MHIERANEDAFRTDQAGDIDIDMPMQPGPELLTVPNRRLRILSWSAQRIGNCTQGKPQSPPSAHNTARSVPHPG